MPAADFGPFSVDPSSITRLGAAFTPFVNRLLSAEAEAAGLAGSAVDTTYLEHIGDDGVDAVVRAAESTGWLAQGETAFQFKAGDRRPGVCAQELAEADFALEVLRRGGRYSLVIGAAQTARKLENKRKALLDKCAELGIDVQPEQIQVLSADSLARWAERFPALAVWPALGGLGYSAMSFETWSAFNDHAAAYLPSEDREKFGSEVLEQLRAGTTVRVVGVSGLGKSRLMMETLRTSGLDALVVYLKDLDSTPAEILTRLLTEPRQAIVVVDECSAQRHRALREMLPAGSPVRLLTIGEPGLTAPDEGTMELDPIDAEPLDKIIAQRQPSLRAEARRVMTGMADGNVGHALYLARVVANRPGARATDLITIETITQYVTQSLPGGTTRLACAVLALLPRIRYDQEAAGELEQLAIPLGFTPNELRAAARELKDAGLLRTHGRYRAVIPHPMAVFLATTAWEEFGDRIVDELLPHLWPDMLNRLFARAAELGDFAPTRAAVLRLLREDGHFGSLATLQQSRIFDLLTQFAIVAPREVCDGLTRLIGEAPDEDLRSLDRRRSLVWTLAKLVWHTHTFDPAADALLRLAVVTGGQEDAADKRWVELFGALLPGTAALPEQRLAVLGRAADSQVVAVRALAVKGCAQALSIHESIMVSGEVQGGFLVEPRGRPATWEAVTSYRVAAMDLLAKLSGDNDADIAEAAIKELIRNIHPVLEHDAARTHLGDLIAGLGGEALRRARIEMQHLATLFERVPSDTKARQSGLAALRDRLPEPSLEDEFRTLAHGRPFEHRDVPLAARLIETGAQLADPESVIFDVLDEAEVPAAFDLGKALASLATDFRANEQRLSELSQTANGAALPGFLWGLYEAGDAAAFDRFLDEGPGADMERMARLSLTTRGPATSQSRSRVDELLPTVSIAEGAASLFGWRDHLAPDRIAQIVASWLERIEAQQDYNGLVDFIMLTLYNQEGEPHPVDAHITTLVLLRRDFPHVGGQSWAWSQLGRKAAAHDPIRLTALLIDLVDNDAIHLYRDEDAELFRETVQQGGVEAWAIAMARIADGSWRLRLSVDGWLAGLVTIEELTAWVGQDRERARLVASVATPGEAAQMSDVARFLLGEFAEDPDIESSLYGNFVSGGWWGPESAHLQTQLDLLTGWLDVHREVQGVAHWARTVRDSLSRRRDEALRSEAEEER